MIKYALDVPKPWRRVKLSARNFAYLLCALSAFQGMVHLSAAQQSFEYLEGVRENKDQQGNTTSFDVILSDRPNPLAWSHFLGVLASLCAILLIAKSKIDDEALIDTDPNAIRADVSDTMVKSVLLSQLALTDSIAFLLSVAIKSSKTVGLKIHTPSLPGVFQTNETKSKTRSQAWIPKLVRDLSHLWFTGRTRAGKTFVLLYTVAQILQQHKGVRLLICDPHYGKPSEDGFVNDWFGLTVGEGGLIKTNVSEIMASLEGAIAEFEKRKRYYRECALSGIEPKKLPKWIIVIDEGNSTSKAANSLFTSVEGNRFGRFSEILGILLTEAAGYGMHLILATQVVAVGETNISEAMRQQLSVVVLGADTINSKLIKQVGFSEEDRQAAKRLLDVGDRPALVNNRGKISTEIVPPISKEFFQAIKVALGNSKGAVRRWWESIPDRKTKIQQAHKLTTTFALDKSGSANSPLKEIASIFGLEQRADDARYQHVKNCVFPWLLEKARTDYTVKKELPHSEWIDKIEPLTEELHSDFLQLAEKYRKKEISSPLGEICKKLGVRFRKDDPVYTNLIKPYWHTINK